MVDASLIAWPISRLGDGMSALTQICRLAVADAPSGDPFVAPEGIQNDHQLLQRWVELVAGELDIEAEPTRICRGDLRYWLQRARPSVMRLSENQFLLLTGAGKRKVSVLCPDRMIRRIDVNIILTFFTRSMEASYASEADALWEGVPISPATRQRATEAILQQHFRDEPIEDYWVLRLPSQASFWRQFRREGLLRMLILVLVLHTAVYLAITSSWWVAGQAAIKGWTDFRWWILWAVLFCAAAPLRIFRYWLMGVFSVKAGVLLKRRLLVGALQHEPDEIRHQGIGQLLGRVNSSRLLEGAVLNHGLYGLMAVFELRVGIRDSCQWSGGAAPRTDPAIVGAWHLDGSNGSLSAAAGMDRDPT